MRPRTAVLALAVLVLVGCIPTTPTGPPPEPKLRAYRAEALDGAGRLRVLVAPFQHDDRAAARVVTNAFALELEKLQLFEVLGPDSPEGQALERLWLRDSDGLSIHTLTTLRRRLRVQALALGQILHYRPYDPPVLSLRVQVISTGSAAVLWAAEGAFDAREHGVQARMRRFHARELADEPRGLGWRWLLHSPRHFAQYCAYELVATVRPAPAPAVAARSARWATRDPYGR